MKDIKQTLALIIVATAMVVCVFAIFSAHGATNPPDIWFGKKTSAVEVYFVSDWLCPFCRKVEPEIERMAPAIGAVAKYTFLDDPIHRESTGFMPYGISILVNEKGNYFKARKALVELATKTRKPDNQSVGDAMRQYGIQFKLADFATVASLTASGLDIIRKSKVIMTPTVIVRNSKTGKQQLLVGADQIRAPVVLATIKSLES